MPKWEPHDNDTLQYATDLLEYHINQYISTLHWLNEFEHDRQSKGRKKDTAYNAVLEDNLVHARALIRFLEPLPSRPFPTDVFALEYFQDQSDVYEPLKDEFLNTVASDVGGYMVHVTCKGMPVLKSEKHWPVEETARRLVPPLKVFLETAPPDKVDEHHRQKSLEHIVTTGFEGVFD